MVYGAGDMLFLLLLICFFFCFLFLFFLVILQGHRFTDHQIATALVALKLLGEKGYTFLRDLLPGCPCISHLQTKRGDLKLNPGINKVTITLLRKLAAKLPPKHRAVQLCWDEVNSKVYLLYTLKFAIKYYMLNDVKK